ncbi:VOC family protein [Aquihabitans sp. McL0605]|uniref:VOC family protein n=1 Tax=Aquihabitans sp. McL0605 TaxID=3415671 RepID=UPI003CF6D9D9
MEPTVALQGFSHIGICVSDLDQSARFYVDVLGFSQLYTVDFVGNEVATTMEQEGGFRSTMLLRDDVRLELLQWIDVPMTGSGDRKPMTQLGFTHLSFRVEDVDELSDAVRAGWRGPRAHALGPRRSRRRCGAHEAALPDRSGWDTDRAHGERPRPSLMAPSTADALAARFDRPD